jgi:hypothetical protein
VAVVTGSFKARKNGSEKRLPDTHKRAPINPNPFTSSQVYCTRFITWASMHLNL